MLKNMNHFSVHRKLTQHCKSNILQFLKDTIHRFSSVVQSCPTLCVPMIHSTPGLPVHHQLPEFTQTGKFGLGIQNEAGQRLIKFFQEKAMVIASTLFHPHKRRFYTWTPPDGQYRNQIDYILCSQNGGALYSQQKQDQELTVVQIMSSLLPNSD